MNKNTVYLAVFAVLCVLAGVLVGASISKRPNMPWPGPGRHGFREKAERFMGYGPIEYRWRMGGGGPVEMLTVRLGLSAEQKAKVADIFENTRQEIEEVSKGIRKSIDQIKQKSDDQIMSILTPAQQEEFKALQNEFRRGCGEGGRGPMRERGPNSGEELPSPQG